MENNLYKLTVDDDRMCAKLSLKLPKGDEVTPITPECIEQFLKSEGIVFGVNKNALEMLAYKLKYGREVVVATGHPSTNGNDGYVDFHIPVEDTKKPIIAPDGSVDYLNSLKLAVVEEGQVFAHYEHATVGETGLNIFSEIIHPVAGKELRQPYRGKGFEYDEKTEEYRSLITGHILFRNNVISIEPLYVVSKDLDIDTGNIDFKGDVEVHGDVRSGLSIRADGSIYIHGHVGACNITSKQNITISKGIQGHDRCIISATGDVTCKFVERCSINAGGNIYADSVLNSNITAKGQVLITSRTGVALGGLIYGMQGVIVKVAGNENETPTVIQSGPSKNDIERLSHLRNEIKKHNDDIELLDDKLKELDKLDNSLRTPKIDELQSKIIKARVVRKAERKKITDEITPLSYLVNTSSANAFVQVTGTSYAGVTVRIGSNIFPVTESFKDVIYKSKNGQIICKGNG